jgi:hypothetical protein
MGSLPVFSTPTQKEAPSKENTHLTYPLNAAISPLISSRHRFSSLLPIRLSFSNHIKNRSGGMVATLMKNRSAYNFNPKRIL